MKTRILTAVLFAAALVPVNASAHTRSIEIDTGNFDLSTQAGRDMLDARIDSAVRNLCRSGQRGVDITEVLVRRRIAGMGGQGSFQRVAGAFVVATLRIQHGQVVVRLGQLREIPRQVGEDLDGLIGARHPHQHQAARETRFGILRAGLQMRIQQGQRLSEAAAECSARTVPSSRIPGACVSCIV